MSRQRKNFSQKKRKNFLTKKTKMLFSKSDKLLLTLNKESMKKTEKLLFEIIGFDLHFDQNVINKYEKTSPVQNMQKILLNPSKMLDQRQTPFEDDISVLAKIQLRADIESLQKKLNPASPFALGYQLALKFLSALEESRDPQDQMFSLITAIEESQYGFDTKEEHRITTHGVSVDTIRMVFQNILLFPMCIPAQGLLEESLRNVAKEILKADIKAAV